MNSSKRKSRVRKSRVRKSRVRKSLVRKSRARKSLPQKSKSIRRKSKSIRRKSRARKSRARKSRARKFLPQKSKSIRRKSIRRKSIRRKSRATKFYSPSKRPSKRPKIDEGYLNHPEFTITPQDNAFLYDDPETVLKAFKRPKSLVVTKPKATKSLDKPLTETEKDDFLDFVFTYYKLSDDKKENAFNKLSENEKKLIDVFVNKINELKSRVSEIYESERIKTEEDKQKFKNEKKRDEELKELETSELSPKEKDVTVNRIRSIIVFLGNLHKQQIHQNKRKATDTRKAKEEARKAKEEEKEKARLQIKDEKKKKMDSYRRKAPIGYDKKSYYTNNNRVISATYDNVENTGKGSDNYHCSFINTRNRAGEEITVPHATFVKNDKNTYEQLDPTNSSGNFPYVHYHYGINPNRYLKKTDKLIMRPSFWPRIREDPQFAYVDEDKYIDNLDSINDDNIQFGSDILQTKLREKYYDCAKDPRENPELDEQRRKGYEIYFKTI